MRYTDKDYDDLVKILFTMLIGAFLAGFTIGFIIAVLIYKS